MKFPYIKVILKIVSLEITNKKTAQNVPFFKVLVIYVNQDVQLMNDNVHHLFSLSNQAFYDAG